MFDPRRRFVTCAFCDRTDLTAEHIFGRGLAARAGLKSEWTGFDALRMKEVRGGGPLLNITSSILCSGCNNAFHGTMSSSIEPLINLAFGRARGVTPQQADILLEYFERLAFLVDVLTSNHEVSDQHFNRPEHQRNIAWRRFPPTYTHEQRKAWMAGDHSTAPAIYIGRHKGVLGLPPFANVAQGMVISDGAMRFHKIFQIVVRELAIVLMIGRDHPREPGPAFVRLLPGTRARTPFGAVTYDDHFALYNYEPGIEALRRQLGNPAFRAAWEAEVRRRADTR